MKRSLFICTTPTQIINAVNIIENNILEDATIIITDYISSNYDLYMNIRDSKKISNVQYIMVKEKYFIEIENINKIHKIYLKTHLLFHKNSISKYLVKDYFNEVYIGGPDLLSLIIYNYYRMFNRNIVFHFYEEGIFTYGIHKYIKGIKFRLECIYLGIKVKKSLANIYVYQPQLVSGYKNKVKKISFKNYKDQLLINLNGNIDLNCPKNSIIFVDSDFPQREIDYFQIQFIKEIAKQNKNVFVALHPRSKRDKYGNLNILNNTLPLENYQKRLKELNPIFISVYSSTIFNFKIQFNWEPNVILIYEYTKSILVKNRTLKTINKSKIDTKIKNLYGTNNFHILNNMIAINNKINELRE